MKKWWINIFLFYSTISVAQEISLQPNVDSIAPIPQTHHLSYDTTSDNEFQFSKKRLYFISGIHITGYAGTLFILGQTWYKDYPKTSFHVFNDSKEWLQMDKVGHGWTAYNIAKYSRNLWRWTGLNEKKSVWLGGISSLGYQTILEFLDAYSAQWGWSWTDMASNVGGIGLFMSQELLWKEQRIQFKFSAHKISYYPDLKNRADDLYGKTLQERILKDYNGQTYWLSFNPKSFFSQSKIPSWLNFSIGYGATGLFGGFENIGYDKNGNLIFSRLDIKRERQWYFSPDIDFTKIKTNKKGIKMLFTFLNMVKIPAPALELSGGKLKGHFLYF